LGKLSDRVISAKGVTVYQTALKMFFQWLVSMQMVVALTTFDFDLQVVEFVEAEWSEGGTRAHIGNLLSGLHHFVPALRGCLKGSWRLHAAWGRQEMPDRASPIPRIVVQALAGLAFSWGYWDVAICILVQYSTFLRTGEMTSMRKQMFRFAQSGCQAVLVLPHTKGSSRTGAVESVVLDDAALVRAVRAYLDTLQPGHTLLQRTPQQFRKLWKLMVTTVGLDAEVVRPYGLRRGGATEHFLLHGRLDWTAVKGRWASV